MLERPGSQTPVLMEYRHEDPEEERDVAHAQGVVAKGFSNTRPRSWISSPLVAS